LNIKKPHTDCFVCTGLPNIKARAYAAITLMRGDRHSKQSLLQKWADCPLELTKVIASWWFRTAKWAQLSLVSIALNINLRTISLPQNNSLINRKPARSNFDCFMPLTTFHAIPICLQPIINGLQCKELFWIKTFILLC